MTKIDPEMRLQTKFMLVMIGFALFVVAGLSCAFVTQILKQLVQETDKRAGDLAEQVFIQAKYALVEAAQQGLHPDSDSPKDIHDYVRHAFEINEGLRTQLIAARSNPLVYEVSVTDTDGLVLASTDENLPGKFLPRRPSLSQLVGRSFLHQMKVLRKPQLFEHDYFFKNANKPFGEVRVILDSALLVQEIRVKLRVEGTIVLVVLIVSVLLATMVSGILKTPGASPGGSFGLFVGLIAGIVTGILAVAVAYVAGILTLTVCLNSVFYGSVIFLVVVFVNEIWTMIRKRITRNQVGLAK